MMQFKLYAMIAALIASAASAAWLTYKVEEGRIKDLQIAWDKAQIKAVTDAKDEQIAADKVVLDAALKQAADNTKIEVQTVTVVKEVPRYVKDTSTCITYGLVRVLDAAARGDDPADLALPAGKSDDACAPVKATALARSVADNYGTARANAQQLTNLIAATRQLIDNANAPARP